MESLATQLALEGSSQRAKDRQADDQPADDAERLQLRVEELVDYVRANAAAAGVTMQAGFFHEEKDLLVMSAKKMMLKAAFVSCVMSPA